MTPQFLKNTVVFGYKDIVYMENLPVLIAKYDSSHIFSTYLKNINRKSFNTICFVFKSYFTKNRFLKKIQYFLIS
jgi:hypothetical protein